MPTIEQFIPTSDNLAAYKSHLDRFSRLALENLAYVAGKNYAIEENPQMGAQGLFYYYQTMSKALTAANIDKLKLDDGTEADWRSDLGGRLLATQRGDGSWANSNGRWMESNPVLATAYNIMSLEQIYHSIPEK